MLGALSTGVRHMDGNMPLVLDADLGLSHLSATICAEIASGLSTARDILEKYDISQEQWDKLKHSPVFRKMLAEAVAEWSGDLNAGKRITKKAEIMLEDSLPVLYEIAHDDQKPSQQRLESIKQMGVFAGKTGKGDGEGKGGSVGGAVINIHVDTGGDNPQTVTIDGHALESPESEAA